MSKETSQAPGVVARTVNRAIGFLAAQGLAPGYCHELQVVGRKSGKVYTTPVNLLEYGGKLWLVGARGPMQWTRNAESAGQVVLRRGKRRTTYAVRTTALAERAPVLKCYLETWSSQVQGYFSVRAGAPVDEFTAIAEQHPVYELTPQPAPST